MFNHLTHSFDERSGVFFGDNDARTGILNERLCATATRAYNTGSATGEGFIDHEAPRFVGGDEAERIHLVQEGNLFFAIDCAMKGDLWEVGNLRLKA